MLRRLRLGALALLLDPAASAHALPGVGISPVRSQHLENPTLGDTGPQEGDLFGGSLAIGDFDGDGFAELAVGSTSQSIGGVELAGAATVLRGALFADGFESDSVEYWTVPASSLDLGDPATTPR